MHFITPVLSYVDGLVHPAARGDALTAARHRAFIAPRLIGSLAALASLPIYLVARGTPGALELAAFAWLVAPILIAFFLSRTGRYEIAHVLSSLALAGLATVIAFGTGGIGSFVAVWLVVVPVEAALSASRRVVALAAGIALGAAVLLAALGAGGVLPAAPADPHGTLAMFGIVTATLYAAGLALAAEQLARASTGLLIAEEDRYRLLARNMTDVIIRHGRNGDVLFASSATVTLFGVAPSELAGHGLFDRVHVADRPAYLTAIADAADGAERALEFRIRRDGGDARSGSFVWVEMRCRPLDHDGAKPSERDVVAVLRDISDRKTQEQALEVARAESERANAAKGRFLAIMSHELRTPLNAIIGFSDMLTDDSLTLAREREREYARLINESGRHLLSVVNGILDMSKMETGNFEIVPEPFAPGETMASCCGILALKAQESGVMLTTRIAPGLPELTADRRAFNQILINLISNAIKFTLRGGKVDVAARCEGGDLVLAVEDTGVGIAQDDLPQLGTAFFQARASYDRRHDGTGLGLSIVKGLVNLHGGAMEIASRLGEGTRVTVRLPIEGDGRRAVDPVSLVARRARETMTIVEDRVKQSA